MARKTRALLKGLAEAIDRQFLTWKLTEAERDVGLLIRKGLSLKDIAAARVTSERTIRAQARSIYAKAGLSGRAALSAFSSWRICSHQSSTSTRSGRVADSLCAMGRFDAAPPSKYKVGCRVGDAIPSVTIPTGIRFGSFPPVSVVRVTHAQRADEVDVGRERMEAATARLLPAQP